MFKLIDTAIQMIDNVRQRVVEFVSGHVTIDLHLPPCYSRVSLKDLIAKHVEEALEALEVPLIRVRLVHPEHPDETLPGFSLQRIAEDFLEHDTLLAAVSDGELLEFTRYAA